VGRLIMVPPTFDSSARRRVNKHAAAINAVMLELGKAHHGAANPRLFRSLSDLFAVFLVIVNLIGC